MGQGIHSTWGTRSEHEEGTATSIVTLPGEQRRQCHKQGLNRMTNKHMERCRWEVQMQTTGAAAPAPWGAEAGDETSDPAGGTPGRASKRRAQSHHMAQKPHS